MAIFQGNLARRSLARLRDAAAARRLKTLEEELTFARAQFDELANAGPPHKVFGRSARLWELQRRMDELQARIARLTS